MHSRGDPRVSNYSGMPAMGSGTIARLKDASWHNIIFIDLAEYERFRADLAAGTLAPPTRKGLASYLVPLVITALSSQRVPRCPIRSCNPPFQHEHECENY